MKSVCVYCGSSPGNRPEYAEGARLLGRTLAESGLALVYGGGKVGLMGIVADAVLEHGGSAIGIIPDALMQKEVGHRGLTELHVVRNMHERKQMMADRADAFIAMPGGVGTFEELCSRPLPGCSWATTTSRWACSMSAGSMTACWASSPMPCGKVS